MDRRNFLQLLAGLTAGTALSGCSKTGPARDRVGELLPRRVLGSTGIDVTCLGLGGYHVGWTTEALAQATIEAALEEGVRFFDTAQQYGAGLSEERYGKWLTPRYRDVIFLMTKSTATTSTLAQEHLDGSLKRLKCDHIDLWQIHSLTDEADVDKRLKEGVLEVALKAREEGKIRYIGFTGHASPYALNRMLEQTGGDHSPFTACQFPVNPVDAASKHSFLEHVLPNARKAGLGVLAMKTLADGRFFGSKVMNEKQVWTAQNPVVPDAITLADCIHFALSLPITTLITGAEKPEFLREKAGMVRTYEGMKAGERKELVEKVAAYATAGKVEYYKLDQLKG